WVLRNGTRMGETGERERDEEPDFTHRRRGPGRERCVALLKSAQPRAGGSCFVDPACLRNRHMPGVPKHVQGPGCDRPWPSLKAADRALTPFLGSQNGLTERLRLGKCGKPTEASLSD